MSKLMLVLTLILVACTPAFADTIFDFSFSGPVLSGSGTMTAPPSEGESPPFYVISTITGTTTYNSTTSSITGLVPPFGEPLGNDNLIVYPPLLPAFGFVTSRGLAYTLSDGSIVTLDYAGNGGYSEVLRFPTHMGGFSDTAPIIVTPAVPEPDSLILLVTGVIGTIGLIRRRIYR